MALHVEKLGAGPDLVLLHGWGLHGGVWNAIAPRLAGRFRLHVFDLPGHGHSRDCAFGTLDEVVDTVAHQTPEGSLVCGWSLGGLIALRLATRHRARAGKLALVSTTPSFVQRRDWTHAMARGTLESFAEGLRAEPEKTLRTFVSLNALGGTRARDRMRALATLLAERGTPSKGSLAAGLALLLDADLRDEVRAIDLPAAVIHGGRDVLVPPEAGRWLAAALPRARFVDIAQGAHLPFVSHPEPVANALEAMHG